MQVLFGQIEHGMKTSSQEGTLAGPWCTQILLRSAQVV